MNGAPIITVRNLTKKYGPTVALDRINLDFQAGVTGLIGPNGAGKTTLIKIMLGLIFPDEGSVRIFGYDVPSDSLMIRQRAGALHERPSYPGFMKTEEYLQHVAELYESHRNIPNLLELVDLYSARNKRIQELSGGMRRRLGIAQAIVGNPKIVFLDEPTANLDVEGRNDVINLLGKLRRTEGMSIIVSSHILSELERVCDNVIFIKAGQVITTGKTSKIISRYAKNRYRVVCSDSIRLAEVLRTMEEFRSVRPSGSRIVLVSYEGGSTKRLWATIEGVAEEIGVEIDGLMKSESLEDTYLEVMK